MAKLFSAAYFGCQAVPFAHTAGGNLSDHHSPSTLDTHSRDV